MNNKIKQKRCNCPGTASELLRNCPGTALDTEPNTLLKTIFMLHFTFKIQKLLPKREQNKETTMIEMYFFIFFSNVERMKLLLAMKRKWRRGVDEDRFARDRHRNKKEGGGQKENGTR